MSSSVQVSPVREMRPSATGRTGDRRYTVRAAGRRKQAFFAQTTHWSVSAFKFTAHSKTNVNLGPIA